MTDEVVHEVTVVATIVGVNIPSAVWFPTIDESEAGRNVIGVQIIATAAESHR
jgi:hypothetical protein